MVTGPTYTYMTYPIRYGNRSHSSWTHQSGQLTRRPTRKDRRVNGNVTLQDTSKRATFLCRRRPEVLCMCRELHRGADMRCGAITQVRVTSVVPSENCAMKTRSLTVAFVCGGCPDRYLLSRISRSEPHNPSAENASALMATTYLILAHNGAIVRIGLVVNDRAVRPSRRDCWERQPAEQVEFTGKLPSLVTAQRVW